MADKGKKELGRRGEELACGHLQSLGHTVLERNWQCGHLEVDIISRAADGLHFTEVKSLVAPVSDAPEHKVGTVKRNRLCAAALRYLGTHPSGSEEVFFDIVSVVFDGGSVRIEYFPQAWIPFYYGR